MWQFIKNNNGFATSIRKQYFWILTCIILSILFVYYSDFLGSERWFPWFWNWTIFEFRNNVLGSLFIIPLIFAAVFLGIQGVILTWLICGMLMLPRILDYFPDIKTFVSSYVFYSIPFFISILFKAEANWRRKEKKALIDREAERQRYMSQIFKAHEDERQRIAQELHDEIIQSLIALSNNAQTIINDRSCNINECLTAKELKTNITSIRDAARGISKNVRDLCLDLRPYILDDMGFVSATRWLVDRLHPEINIILKINGEEKRLNPEVECMLYRIIQESINNIKRHSGATEASIFLDFNQNSSKIIIEDNGKGFLLPEKISDFTRDGKLGVTGIEQRVKFLNGILKIESGEGRGTRITIDFPILHFV